MSATGSRELHIISINHQKADAANRIALDLSYMDWFSLEAYARFSLGVIGWVKISTCNRIEILIDAPANVDIQRIIDKWIDLSQIDFDHAQFDCISGSRPVVKYLLELSTGLRSAIYGDDQILTQVKQAFEESRSTESGLSTLIERAYQCVMRCHKEIMGTTEFKNQGVSLAYYGLKYAKDYFKDQSQYLNKTVLIIGAGNMAEQVVKYLPKFNFKKILITNRTIAKAQQLATNSKIEVVNYEGLEGIDPDIVLSCSVHGRSMIDEQFDPELIIDFSLNKIPVAKTSAKVVDLEEMQTAIDEKNARRNAYIGDVSQIIETHCIGYSAWVEKWQMRHLKGH